MSIATQPGFTVLAASINAPVTIYYCKAGIQTGRTIRIQQGRGKVWEASEVEIQGAWATMTHDNSKGKAKASGARCVMVLTLGCVRFPEWAEGVQS